MSVQSQYIQKDLVERAFADAAGYASLYEGSGQAACFLSARLRHVFSLLSTIGGGRILDVGCGPGILLSRLGGSQFELFGLDLCPEMIAAAKARTGKLSAKLAVGRIEQMPFRAESFDVILALGSLEYLSDQRAGLKEIARLAKPDALVVISMLNGASLYRWWERFVYGPWKAARSGLRGRRTEQSPTLWMHGRKSLTRMMRECELEALDTFYYDVNVCVPPFDLRYWTYSSELNHWVENHCPRQLYPLVNSAFIVTARRSGLIQ